MTVASRLSALWASAQYLIILGLIAAVSIGLNLWQLKRAWTAPLRAEVAQATESAKTSEELNAATAARERKLLAAADLATGQLSKAGKDYSRAVANRPLEAPQCAPGQERIDAVNAALGGKK